MRKIPGINPEFVNSLSEQISLLEAGRVDEAAAANKTNAEYISIFPAALATNNGGVSVNAGAPVNIQVRVNHDVLPSDRAGLEAALTTARESAQAKREFDQISAIEDAKEKQCEQQCKIRFPNTLSQDLYCMIDCQQASDR